MFRLSRLLLLLLLTYQLVVQAADTPGDSLAPKRTLYNIIWECVSTTIICAWTAVHPNIPPQEGLVKRTLRRLELMFWAIVAPEILPAWALNQRLAAKTVKDVYNEGKGYREEEFSFLKALKGAFSWCETKPASPAWTDAHGHFLIMGGLHLVEPVEVDLEAPNGIQANVVNVQEGRVTILTLEMLRNLVVDPEFEIRVTEAEIADKSKGDALSKIIFILQSSWFICQCIARHVQGLSLTQLELTTLALASLNATTFILWWDKPLGVQTPLRVYMKRKLMDAEREADTRDRSARSKLLLKIREIRSRGIREICSALLADIKTSVAEIRDLPLDMRVTHILTLFILLFPYLLAFMLTFMGLGVVVFVTIYDLLGAASSFPAEATHVPTFYVPVHRYSDWWHILVLMALGTLFGGIHCVGWNLFFRTSREQILWRIASVAVTILPTAVPLFVVVGFISVFLTYGSIGGLLGFIFYSLGVISHALGVISRRLRLLAISDFFDQISNIIDSRCNSIYNLMLEFEISTFRSKVTFRNLATIGVPQGSITPGVYLFVYASARLLLLGLAVTLLRHQPPSAFISVAWTEVFPHIQ